MSVSQLQMIRDLDVLAKWDAQLPSPLSFHHCQAEWMSRKLGTVVTKDNARSWKHLLFVPSAVVQTHLDDKRVELKKVLGEGSFGIVFLAEIAGIKKKVALKALTLGSEMPFARKNFAKERCCFSIFNAVFSGRQRKHFPAYLGCCSLEGEPVLLFRAYELTFAQLVSFARGPRLPLYLITNLCRQILMALSFLKELNILHGDLTSRNILVHWSGKKRTWQIKVADFGTAQLIGQRAAETEITASYWRAPEVTFRLLPYTQAVDVWSAGTVFGEALLGRVLWQSPPHQQHLQVALNLGPPPVQWTVAPADPSVERKYKEILLSLSGRPIISLRERFSFEVPPFVGEEFRWNAFVGTIEKMLCWEPNMRPSVQEALQMMPPIAEEV